jgi:hypothetical protein
MTAAERAEYVSRDTILKMLSDEEMAKVGTAESATGLKEGEQYLDLEHLDKGIQHAQASMSKLTTSHIVPRSAVRGETWSKILAQLDG